MPTRFFCMDTSKKFAGVGYFKFSLNSNNCNYIAEQFPDGSFKMRYAKNPHSMDKWRSWREILAAGNYDFFAEYPTLEVIEEKFGTHNAMKIPREDVFAIIL